MYRKNSNSWLKHWDFIILDLVALQLAYVSSFVLRMGINDLDHNGLYLNIGIFIALVDICTAFFTEPYHGIMRRGYFVEFKNVLKHVFIVSALVIVYLFMSKQGSMTSRLVITSFIPMSVILIYAVRIIWKRYLLKHGNMLYSKINMLLVSTSDEIDSMLKRVEQNVFNEFDIVGIVLADREPEENELIEGIPVVSKIDTVTEYIQTRWVDALLVGIKKKTLIPEDLFETCVNMGITVHECLDDRTGWTGNHSDFQRQSDFLTTGYDEENDGHLWRNRWNDSDRYHYNIPCSGNLYCFTGANLLLSDESRKKRKII